jgi:hypothetical protein
MASVDTRKHQRRNRAELLARAADATSHLDEPDFLDAAPLHRGRRRTRAALARVNRELAPIYDELIATPPGPEQLATYGALLSIQVMEELRLREQWIALVRKGDEEAAEGAYALISEHRRGTRHLVQAASCAAKLAKVLSEITIGSGPSEMRIYDASAIAQHYASLPPASPQILEEADVVEPE